MTVGSTTGDGAPTTIGGTTVDPSISAAPKIARQSAATLHRSWHGDARPSATHACLRAGERRRCEGIAHRRGVFAGILVAAP